MFIAPLRRHWLRAANNNHLHVSPGAVLWCQWAMLNWGKPDGRVRKSLLDGYDPISSVTAEGEICICIPWRLSTKQGWTFYGAGHPVWPVVQYMGLFHRHIDTGKGCRQGRMRRIFRRRPPGSPAREICR
jgi:hypothetical protein